MSKMTMAFDAIKRFYCDLRDGYKYPYRYTLDELKDELENILLDNCPCCHRSKGTGHKMDCSYRD